MKRLDEIFTVTYGVNLELCYLNLLVNSCTLKGGWADEMGGAIYNRGTLTVKGTEIKENNARIGGGIYNNSSLEVDNSLIWSNTATVQGTDIANEGTYTNSTTEEQFDSWLDYYTARDSILREAYPP